MRNILVNLIKTLLGLYCVAVIAKESVSIWHISMTLIGQMQTGSTAPTLNTSYTIGKLAGGLLLITVLAFLLKWFVLPSKMAQYNQKAA